MQSNATKVSILQDVQALVVGSLCPTGTTQVLRDFLRQLSDNALAAIAQTGAGAHFIEASAPDVDASIALDGYDCLLVLGGADADPACYGQKVEVDTIYGANAEADAFELDLIRRAEQRGIPILGICRGMQLINIHRGGDLHQDIGEDTMHFRSNENAFTITHSAQPADGSRLAAIYGGRVLQVRSAHHQAVRRLGDGLIVSCTADDGIIEAVEGTGKQWSVGVQWHPEDPNASREDINLLFKGFIDAAREFKAS